jgi:hypothetical protein
LLASLPPDAYARLIPERQPVSLQARQVLAVPGEPIAAVDCTLYDSGARGRIAIRDRDGLESIACEDYRLRTDAYIDIYS